jgi:hypothetical protein
MPKDSARLTVLLDLDRKQAFDALCSTLGTTASAVVRNLIAEYLAGKEPEAPLVFSRKPLKAETPRKRK